MYALVTGVVVLLASGYVALNIREVSDGIDKLYANLAASNRGPAPLDWQPRPNARQSVFLAWVLVLAAAGLGFVFVVMGALSL